MEFLTAIQWPCALIGLFPYAISNQNLQISPFWKFYVLLSIILTIISTPMSILRAKIVPGLRKTGSDFIFKTALLC